MEVRKMLYRMMGWAHANAAWAARGQSGQGTVEYVGVMLLLATVLTAVVAAARGKDFALTTTITDEIKNAIGKVTPGN